MLDFPQPTCVHVENEASNGYILGDPWMRPDLLDLRPSVLLRVLEGKQAHRDRRGVTRFSGDLVVQLLVSEGCEPAAGVIEAALAHKRAQASGKLAFPRNWRIVLSL
jgi:hypothetical protein